MLKLENRLNDIYHFNRLIESQNAITDFVTLFLGARIGYGASREVYEYNLDPNKYVVKIEKENYGHNMSEYLLYNEIQDLEGNLKWVKDWFAPIKYVSPNGNVLIMERTFKDYKNKERPKEVPDFFMDVKYDNFGWLSNGKFVCHDYGFIYRFIEYKKKMQKVKWN